MNCEIIPADKIDLPTIIELWENSGIRIEPEDSSKQLSRFLDNKSSRFYKATFQEKIVGAIMCGTDGRYGYIHHVAVDDDFRKKGVGRALVEKCQEFFNEIGIDTKTVFVWNTNVTALEFWESIGFTIVDGLRVLAN